MTLKELDEIFNDLNSKDNAIRYEAFQKVLELTEKKVNWIYDKWDILIEKLSSDNSYQRSLGIMILANLCKSDSEKRFNKIIEQYLIHFEDEKFITARQCIQNIWKIAVCDKKLSDKIVKAMETSFYENKHLKTHGNLIKQDIINSMVQIYKLNKEKVIIERINALVEEENDNKLKVSLKKIVNNS